MKFGTVKVYMEERRKNKNLNELWLNVDLWVVTSIKLLCRGVVGLILTCKSQ